MLMFLDVFIHVFTLTYVCDVLCCVKLSPWLSALKGEVQNHSLSASLVSYHAGSILICSVTKVSIIQFIVQLIICNHGHICFITLSRYEINVFVTLGFDDTTFCSYSGIPVVRRGPG